MTDTFEIVNRSCYVIDVKCWNGHHYDSVSLKRGETKTFIRGLTYLVSCGALLDPISVLDSKNITKYNRICIRATRENGLPLAYVSWGECEYL